MDSTFYSVLKESTRKKTTRAARTAAAISMKLQSLLGHNTGKEKYQLLKWFGTLSDTVNKVTV